MGEVGLVEVANPSEMFLSHRSHPSPGSVVVASLEGTRPFLVELQALVARTNFTVPQRIVTGLDYKRTSLLVAVLEKKVGLPLREMDVFVNVVGGVRLAEPAADLGILVAIASSFRDVEIDDRTVVVGEVGLSGEIRRVSGIEVRLKEAAKLGFVRAIVPAGMKEDLDRPADIEIVPCQTVLEALKHTLSARSVN
jgi:DNA repair protein RadA/Sms